MGVRNSVRLTVITTTCLTLALASVAQAYAEGYTQTYMSNFRAGSKGRTWTDKNSDTTHTTLRLSNCRVKDSHGNRAPDGNAIVVVQLTKEGRSGRGENRGSRTFRCWNSSTQNWGRQPEGIYHYTIQSVNGKASLIFDASPVLMWW